MTYYPQAPFSSGIASTITGSLTVPERVCLHTQLRYVSQCEGWLNVMMIRRPGYGIWLTRHTAMSAPSFLYCLDGGLFMRCTPTPLGRTLSTQG